MIQIGYVNEQYNYRDFSFANEVIPAYPIVFDP